MRSTVHHFVLLLSVSKGKVCIRANCGANPGFYCMRQLGVALLPPGWDASPSQGYPTPLPPRSIKFTGTPPFIHLGGERHREGNVSCPRTQHNVPSQGSHPDRSLPSRAHSPSGHSASYTECRCSGVYNFVVLLR